MAKERRDNFADIYEYSKVAEKSSKEFLAYLEGSVNLILELLLIK